MDVGRSRLIKLVTLKKDFVLSSFILCEVKIVLTKSVTLTTVIANVVPSKVRASAV